MPRFMLKKYTMMAVVWVHIVEIVVIMIKG